MRLTVAQVGDSTSVFVVDGENAINVTSVDASLGPDLGAIVSGGQGTAEAKFEAMEDAGVTVVRNPALLGHAMKDRIG